MGVFKWLRRERVTVTTRRPASPSPTHDDESPDRNIGTIRTEEYKRDLAEFQARRSGGKKDFDLSPSRKRDLAELQARRSTGKKDLDMSPSLKHDLAEFQARRSTRKGDFELSPSRKRDLAEFQARRSAKKDDSSPTRKKCGRHSLPVSCAACIADADTTFNYEKKSAGKYKKKSQRRARSTTADGDMPDGLPKIQFLFQNQVFMPGNLFAHSTFKKTDSHSRQRYTEDNFAQRQLNFKEDDDPVSPPLFYKNNSLPFDEKAFLVDGEEVDGAVGDIGGARKESSRRSPSSDKSSKTSSPASKADSCEAKLTEVLCELKSFDQWADDQLRVQSMSPKSEDSKSDASTYGLPVVAASDIDVTVDKDRVWNSGTWGAVLVLVRRLPGVSVATVRRRENVEVDILRKCRHPNIILLMGLYPDVRGDVHIICERCVDSLHGVLHVQGRILSVQTAVQYMSDIANALVFLRMRGYIHTELTSHCIMINSRDAAKLAEFQPCVKLVKDAGGGRSYELYDSQPQYVNIGEIHAPTTLDCEPLLSTDASEAYLTSNAVAKDHAAYRDSPRYRWHAPELFEVDARGQVHPCSRSDVYSLSLVLWESCNAAIPWKTQTYDKLKELYTLWKAGIRLPADGSYPGCLLAALRSGLKLSRAARPDLTVFAATLRRVQQQVDELEYIVLPARLKKKQSNFTNEPWDRSPTDSDCQSPQTNLDTHTTHIDIHTDNKDTSTESDKDDANRQSPLYESIKKETRMYVSEKCFITDEDQLDRIRYETLQDKDYSSACSTPVARIKARIKDIGTPGVLHRTDSTEYCSILSPRNLGFCDEVNKDQSEERPSAKLSRSFTPKSYKPLHIKVPEFNLDCIKSLPKDQNGAAQSSYNFDIKNYSLPNTPIARSNKLRKNAWLSGELSVSERGGLKGFADKVLDIDEKKTAQSAPETPVASATPETEAASELGSSKAFRGEEDRLDVDEPADSGRDSFTGRKACGTEEDALPDTSGSRRYSCSGLSRKILDLPQDTSCRDRTHSWSFRTTEKSPPKPSEKPPDAELLAGVNVKPLVAIHERWIYEAGRKTARSLSLPDDNRIQVSAAVKPASHRVDPLQKSLPQLAAKRPLPMFLRGQNSLSPSTNGRNGLVQSGQFCQARDKIARSLNLTQEPDWYSNNRRDPDTCSPYSPVSSSEDFHPEPKANAATDTSSIEEFIRDLIRRELQHLLSEISDDSFETQSKSEDLLNRGVANVLDALKGDEDSPKKEQAVSKFKINGTNKPVVQITFSRSGDNCLQVTDNCVNVTISDGGHSNSKQNRAFDKLNKTLDDTLTEDFHTHSLKRCQTFRTLQEARSTEDLYIDDDLSTQMQENFGGKVKLIPLHGSLHEILCEKEDDCCLIKFKQENCCDTIFFKCDNSDTESRDAIDGTCNPSQDTVLYKRISLIEERVQRIFPKDKRATTPILLRKKRRVDAVGQRPKSEVFVNQLTKETRVLSNSTPSLPTCDDREVEVNIENIMSYQDSSSDECLKCQADYDDFELLEEEIDKEITNSSSCKCLEKISEENLSTINEETSEKEQGSD